LVDLRPAANQGEKLMARFEDGNDPGNGKGKQGKGEFTTTNDGDHILGTQGDDGSEAEPIDLLGGDDLFNGLGGNDFADGGAGNDNLNGGDGDDTLNGNAGDDSITGGDGEDTLTGGLGDDVIEGGAGADSIGGGAGNDTASYASSDAGVNVSLLDDTASGGHAEGDELDNIENLIGSAFDDTLAGDAGANVIEGGDGEDSITGGDGADTLSGGDGGDNDTINVGTAANNGRDGDVDVIVAAASFAENGTDAVFNYDESTNVLITNDDIFDFSGAFDFASADSADWAAELDTFLTFDQPNGEIETAGNAAEVWFKVSELGESVAFNQAEQVSVVVDNALFTNDGTGWTLVDDDILV